RRTRITLYDRRKPHDLCTLGGHDRPDRITKPGCLTPQNPRTCGPCRPPRATSRRRTSPRGDRHGTYDLRGVAQVTEDRGRSRCAELHRCSQSSPKRSSTAAKLSVSAARTALPLPAVPSDGRPITPLSV